MTLIPTIIGTAIMVGLPTIAKNKGALLFGMLLRDTFFSEA